jgi:hypothetical protein
MPEDDRVARVHDAIQETAVIGSEALLIGWVYIAEWCKPDGSRYISKNSPGGTPHWTTNGLLFEGLHSKWPTQDDADG